MERLLKSSSFKSKICFGIDHIRLYEFSYLNSLGKPINKQLDIYIPAASFSIVSFELKMKMRSFENRKFSDESKVISALRAELFPKIENIEFCFTETQEKSECYMDLQGSLCIDEYLNLSKKASLDIQRKDVHGYSQNLLMNNFMFTCAQTKQPVWGRILINTRHFAWELESLSEFFVSYRDEEVYQFDIVNKLYNALINQVKESHFLKIQAQITRRGGIESNFIRCNKNDYSWICNTRCIVQ